MSFFSILLFICYQLAVGIYYLGYLLSFIFSIPFNNKKNRAVNLLGWGCPRITLPVDIWFHAVSAGEVKLVHQIILTHLSPQSSNQPSSHFFISYMSNSAEKMAKEILSTNQLPRNLKISTSYLPLDFYFTMTYWVKKIRPKKLVIIEHDFWINQITAVKQQGGEAIVLNYTSKLKDRKLFDLFPSILRFTQPFNEILTQTEDDRDWLNHHLPPTTKITFSGNLKYNFKPANHQKNLLDKTPYKPLINKLSHQQKKLNKTIVVLGSTHEGEEKLLINQLTPHLTTETSTSSNAYTSIHSAIFLIIIPRHPERAKSILKNLKLQLPSLTIQLWSDWEKAPSPKENIKILIIDRLGLSEDCYKISDLTLIGDSFIPSQGGHNFLESLQYNTATLYGEHFKSYPDITPEIERLGGVKRVNLKKLEVINQLIQHPNERKKMGEVGNKFLHTISYNYKLVDDALKR